MNMASKEKKTFIASEWVPAILRTSDRWLDPVTGLRGSAFYIGDNGLSNSFTTADGNTGVIISKPKAGEPEPPTRMVQVHNGLAVLDTLPKNMMMHKTTLSLMTVEDYKKLSAKVSTALTEGVSATA